MKEREAKLRRNKASFIKSGAGWILSVLLAAPFIFLCVWETFGKKLPGNGNPYSIVLLGDSEVGDTFDGEGVAAYLEKDLGKSVLKGGFGGTCASYDGEKTGPVSVSYQLSLAKLVKAIINHDFSVQKAQISYGERYRYSLLETLEYFPSAIKELSGIDFSGLEYLVIEHGTNDYNSGCPLDNPKDPYDIRTFGGAMRDSIRQLQNAYPELKIILMTPTKCFFPAEKGGWTGCDEMDFGGGYLEEYVNLELKIAREYGVFVLDNFHEFALDKETQGQYLLDGLHLNGKGQMLIAKRLARLIDQIQAGP